MNHADHVRLIEKGIPHRAGVWADLGSGTGAFTLALRDVAGPEVSIYSVDTDASSLKVQKQQMDARFPRTSIFYLTGDFTKPLSLPPLDGIIMANSLHFVNDKIPVLQKLRDILKPGGKLIIVEYNVDKGNMWVPYPFSFNTLQKLVQTSGFKKPELLATVPSQFLQEMYCAVLV